MARTHLERSDERSEVAESGEAPHLYLRPQVSCHFQYMAQVTCVAEGDGNGTDLQKLRLRSS